MRCLVGIDDTDSSKGNCTTYLAYRIAADLAPAVSVLSYPRLVRLNPNIPFKTRGNAAVSLLVETESPPRAFDSICAKVSELSDVKGGANSGVVFLSDVAKSRFFLPVYLSALSGVVNPHRVRRLLAQHKVKSFELGNGMGLVGAASALAFDESFDHTYELIAYRRRESFGTPRVLDSTSVRDMELATWPHTFNSYDYQKKKVLIAPHGPDPVFLGLRGDSPQAVLRAFQLVSCGEDLQGYMVYMTNQHTDAHLEGGLDWKTFSSGWAEGRVASPSVGPGGHVYFALLDGTKRHRCAVYEPTGDLRRVARMLMDGDFIRAYGGVRRPSTSHPKVLNIEKVEVVSLAKGKDRPILCGTYIASPRANRHLTKPLVRYGREMNRQACPETAGWLRTSAIENRAPA
ncbi:MAG: tRNA(Ile)(2)-agmatinylcytidine synthase [Nitrososphaerales archaeon]